MRARHFNNRNGAPWLLAFYKFLFTCHLDVPGAVEYYCFQNACPLQTNETLLIIAMLEYISKQQQAERSREDTRVRVTISPTIVKDSFTKALQKGRVYRGYWLGQGGRIRAKGTAPNTL